MNYLVDQQQTFPSIFIRPVVDLTQELIPAEKGVVATLGKLHIGNPYYAQILTNPTEKPRSIKASHGGSIRDALAYHIADFFNGYNGKMVVGRTLGADSKLNLIELKKVDSNVEINTSSEINIFGANNIKQWEDTPSTEFMEVLVSACPTEKVSVNIVNENDYITIKLYNENSVEFYSVEGGANFNSENDAGQNNYIGNLADPKILSVKVDTTHADYASTFEVSGVFANGLATDTGALNYEQALKVITSKIESCDYAITADIADTDIVKQFRAITYKAKVPLIVDVHGDTIQQAIDYITTLGFTEDDTYFIWNRARNKFTTGIFTIGLSGFVAGRIVRRNLSKLVKDVEYRVEGIAGVDYPVARVLADELEPFTDDEKTLLTKKRINTVATHDDRLIITDVLSAQVKNVATKEFPVAEGHYFIDRYIARIMTQKFFKNMGEAKRFIKDEVRKLFDNCSLNGYFNSDIPKNKQYAYEVTKSANDEITVKYWYSPEGVMRRGQVAGNLVKGEVKQVMKG